MEDPALYVEGKKFELNDANGAVEAVFTQAMASRPASPLFANVVLYVHGRALKGIFPSKSDGEPEKSQEAVIPELKSRYGSSVLMLHWPHRGSGISFPEAKARACGPALGATVDAFQAYLASHPGAKNLPVTLLTHSMGSIVLEELVKQRGGLLMQGFRGVVISSPASQLRTSQEWLRLLTGTRVIVTINEHDPVLKHEKGALGNASAEDVSPVAASHILYIDVTSLDVRHRYFVFGQSVDAGERKLLERVFRPLFFGQELDVARFRRLIEDRPIYSLA